tara:strand:- start:1067 stop:3337 length:2271 start_codon:yes stop_codon:yes gene_type:complete
MKIIFNIYIFLLKFKSLKKIIFLIIFLLSNILISQNEKKELFVKYTDNKIVIDGILNEIDWSLTKGINDFYEYRPNYNNNPKNPATIKILNDDKFLYIGIKIMVNENDLRAGSLKRDFDATVSDFIALVFDTFNDATNAFVVGSNHLAIQRDLLLFNGGVPVGQSYDMTWDIKWTSKSFIEKDYYTTEWKIPLSSFRFREGETKWRFGSYQRDSKNTAWNMWHKVPEDQDFSDMAFLGNMYFEKPLKKSKSKKSFIPYINGISSYDFENQNKFNDFEFGGDAKFVIDNSLTLDLTVNPDFSQVEVDDQITNLTRFEVSLPEKRQFFIENSDLFSGFGDRGDSNPFFSRRIGIAKDLDGNSIQNKIIAGLRLSGKINNDFRIGLINMLTEEDVENHIASNNNTVLALQHKVFNRSNISFLFINRESIKDYDFESSNNSFNRVVGVDYNLASSDSKWQGKYYFHKSITPNLNDDDISAGFRTNYNSRKINFKVGALYIGDNFNSDLGYIKRKSIYKIDPRISYTFWAENKKILNHQLEIAPFVTWMSNLNNQLSDYFIFTKWDVEFKSGVNFNISLRNQYTYLFDEFDPTGINNGNSLPANSSYHYNNYEIEFNNYFTSSKFKYRLEQNFGEFYNGNKISSQISLGYRFEPIFTGSIELNYDKVSLPELYNSANIFLIAPKIEFTFSKDIYWSSLIQYSNQTENLSFNSRIQWRFAPLSDLFLVYNDNYYTENRYNSIFIPRVKNRSINLKLTYWLDI